MHYLQIYGQPTFAEQLFFGLLQWLMLIYVLMFIVRLIRNRPMKETHSNQYRRFENMSLSTQEFYDTIKRALKDKGYPNVTTSWAVYSEGTVIAGNREYLRIEHISIACDLCAAPFGKDYFISWWVGELPSIGRKVMRSLPWIGPAIESAFYPRGLYILDAEKVFCDCVNQIIEEAINAAVNGKGVRGIHLKETFTVPAKEV